MVCCCDFSGKVPAVGCVDDVLDEHTEFASFFAFVHHFLNSFAHINHFRALWNVSVKMPRFKDGFKRGMVNATFDDAMVHAGWYDQATTKNSRQIIKEHESFFDGLSDIDGLKRERTEQQMRDAIAKGTLMKDLQWVPVKKDDLFFIEAGTIHAIGAGALVAEIQENSNLTYRLYDYDRVGKDGKKRELHIGTKTDVTRLISARMATEFERGLYYGKNE